MRHAKWGRVIGLLFVAATAAACTQAGESSASAPAAARAEAPGAAPPAMDSSAGGSGSGAAPQAPQAPEAKQISQPGVDRKLIRSASLDVSVRSVPDAVRAARDIALGEGGYSGHEQVGAETASLTLHVPSDRFDRALPRLAALGEVTAQSQSAEDVTEQLVDLDSRVQTQRASLERVRALLAQARDIDEVVRVEAEVTRREADLESLLKRREALAGQVALSTVAVRLSHSGAAAATVPEDGGFLDALAAGWSGFLTAGGVVLRVVGYALPFAALAALVLAAVLLWRRKRVAAPAEAPAPEAG